MLRIDHSSSTPPFEQLKNHVAARRASGELPAGHRLPPVRRLAAELGLAPNTVARAYRELEASGIIETRGRNGSFVTGTAESARRAAGEAARQFAATVRSLGLSDADAIALVRTALGGRMTLLGDAERVLFVHAHPDDETISTGALIAALTASGRQAFVLTATRGEQGEVRPGVLARGADLTALREGEWVRATAVLGVAGRCWLGTPPARSVGRPARRYTDSGMAWLDATENLAGPGPDAGPDALTAATPGEISADIAAYARHVGAQALVTYDALGGYGHPDHVALHRPTGAAAVSLGLPCYELISSPRGAVGSAADPAAGSESSWLDLAEHLPVVADALAAYASQLRVDGDQLVHVGGQREPIQLRVGVRLRR